MSGCRLIIAAIPSRTIGWSSTHNTRIFPAVFMNWFRPVPAIGIPLSEPQSAVPYSASAFESTIFQLRNAICLPGGTRNESNRLGRGDAPERTNELPYLGQSDF